MFYENVEYVNKSWARKQQQAGATWSVLLLSNLWLDQELLLWIMLTKMEKYNLYYYLRYLIWGMNPIHTKSHFIRKTYFLNKWKMWKKADGIFAQIILSSFIINFFSVNSLRQTQIIHLLIKISLIEKFRRYCLLICLLLFAAKLWWDFYDDIAKANYFTTACLTDGLLWRNLQMPLFVYHNRWNVTAFMLSKIFSSLFTRVNWIKY